jgi:hypothetical protein
MWNQNDFCDADSGFDYIFGVMSATYGSRFTTHWQDIEPAMIRQVWKERLGRFLTYKPSLDYALGHLKGDFPPSAITFRDYCNAGPNIPEKQMVAIEQQKTQAEIEEYEQMKAKALAKLAELRKSYTS